MYQYFPSWHSRLLHSFFLPPAAERKRKRSEDTSRSAKGLPPLGTLLLSDLATALTPILTRIDISLHLCYCCIDATIITVQMLWRNMLSVTTITVKCWPKT